MYSLQVIMLSLPIYEEFQRFLIVLKKRIIINITSMLASSYGHIYVLFSFNGNLILDPRVH